MIGWSRPRPLGRGNSPSRIDGSRLPSIKEKAPPSPAGLGSCEVAGIADLCQEPLGSISDIAPRLGSKRVFHAVRYFRAFAENARGIRAVPIDEFPGGLL